MTKIGVLLSGCGVYDGSEIQETVFTLLALKQQNCEIIAFAPNINQHHVINHLTGEELSESRNVLVEAARITRGNIQDLDTISVNYFDALVIIGGFGTAKNLTKWAFEGPNGTILSNVQSLIKNTISQQKPILALCMGPVVIAKALENSNFKASLSVGTTAEKSPYDIQAISQGMESIGANALMTGKNSLAIDKELKIITAPCYMMEATITDVFEETQNAVKQLISLV